MPPRAAFVSWGLMCGEEGLKESPWPGMGPAAATFEVTVRTRSFIFTEKRKTQGIAVIGKLYCKRCQKWLELITVCTRLIHQTPCSPRSFKNTALQALFFGSSNMKLPLIYSYSKSHSNILHKLCSQHQNQRLAPSLLMLSVNFLMDRYIKACSMDSICIIILKATEKLDHISQFW